MRRRWLVTVPLICALLGLSAQPAAGGGSTWKTGASSYAPGESASVWAAVSWGHNPDLGDPADGPYGVWLYGPDQAWSAGSVPADAVYVGDIAIDAIDANVGPHVASVEFTVPDLPDGVYAIVHCDWPCTTQLGDITYGELIIDRNGVLPSAATTTVAPTTTAATAISATPTTVDLEAVGIADANDSSGSDSGVPLALIVLGVIAVVAAGLAHRSRRPTPNESLA